MRNSGSPRHIATARNQQVASRLINVTIENNYRMRPLIEIEPPRSALLTTTTTMGAA